MEAIPGEEEGQESVSGLGVVGRLCGADECCDGSIDGHQVPRSDAGLEKIVIYELVGLPHSRCAGARDPRVVAAIGLVEQFDAGLHTVNPIDPVLPVHCGPLTIECRFGAERR